jgi:hypothetical protein
MTWVTDLAREVGDTSGQTAVLVEVSPVSGRSGKCVFVQPGMLYAAHLSKAPLGRGRLGLAAGSVAASDEPTKEPGGLEVAGPGTSLHAL